MRRGLAILIVSFILLFDICSAACQQIHTTDLPLKIQDGSTTKCFTLAEDINWRAPDIFTPAILVTSRTRIVFNFAGHKIRSTPGSRGFLVHGTSSRITVPDLGVMEVTAQTRAEYSRAFQAEADGSLFLHGSLITVNYTTAVALFDSGSEITELFMYAHMMPNEPRQQIVGIMSLGSGTSIIGRLVTRIINAPDMPYQGQSWGIYAGKSLSTTPGVGSFSLRNLDIIAHTPVDLHEFSVVNMFDSRMISNSPANGNGTGMIIGYTPLDARAGAFTGQNISIDTTSSNWQTTSGLFIRSPASVSIQTLKIIGANMRTGKTPLGLFHYEPVKLRTGTISTSQSVSIVDFVFTSIGQNSVAVDVLPNTFFTNPYAINTADTHPVIKLSNGVINGTGIAAVNTGTGSDNVQLDTVAIGGYWWGTRGAGGTTRFSIKRVTVNNACRGIELQSNRTFSGTTYQSSLNVVHRNNLIGCTQPIVDNAYRTDIDTSNTISGGVSTRVDCNQEPYLPDAIDIAAVAAAQQQHQLRSFDPNVAQDTSSPWRLMFI
jgi:hypothetical protein